MSFYWNPQNTSQWYHFVLPFNADRIVPSWILSDLSFWPFFNRMGEKEGYFSLLLKLYEGIDKRWRENTIATTLLCQQLSTSLPFGSRAELRERMLYNKMKENADTIVFKLLAICALPTTVYLHIKMYTYYIYSYIHDVYDVASEVGMI